MKLILGDSLQKLKDLPTNTIDAVVTDPPYGLAFMGKHWDYDVPTIDLWAEVFRVLKPGGHVLSFFGTRTYHAGVIRMEAAGFEIRDMLQWLYGSGFPKSLDVSKAIDKAAGAEREVIGSRPLMGNGKTMKGGNYHQAESDADKVEKQAVFNFTAPATEEAKRWRGFGTALKPANEPIVLARKPLEKGLTVAQNVLKWGTGALAIDACRIAGEKPQTIQGGHKFKAGQFYGDQETQEVRRELSDNTQGRWPANVLLDEEAAECLDLQSGVSKSSVRKISATEDTAIKNQIYGKGYIRQEGGQNDSGGASRFFKVVKLDKHDIFGECHVKSADAAQSNGADSSAQGPALEHSQQDSAAKNQNESLSASIAASSLRSTQAIKKAKRSSAPKSVTQNTDLASHLDIALAAEQLSKSITTDFAQKLAATRPDLVQLIQCPGSTPDFKKCIQFLDLASLAAKSESTDTIATILSLSKSFGSALPAIEESIRAEESNTPGKSCPTRFIYQAKASKRERNAGLEGMPDVTARSGMGGKMPIDDDGQERDRFSVTQKNHHPTVKPIKLMEYLITLVSREGQIVLDPFLGSGTTGCAAVKLSRQFIGIEREAEYIEIARKRIEYWRSHAPADETPDDGQLPLPLEPA